MSSGPAFLALAIIFPVVLAASVVWEHVSVLKERRKIASTSDDARYNAANAAAVYQHCDTSPSAVAESCAVDVEQTDQRYSQYHAKIDEPRLPSLTADQHLLHYEEKSDISSVSSSVDSAEHSVLIQQLFSDWQSSSDENDDRDYHELNVRQKVCTEEERGLASSSRLNDASIQDMLDDYYSIGSSPSSSVSDWSSSSED